jgi:hypothetical protein
MVGSQRCSLIGLATIGLSFCAQSPAPVPPPESDTFAAVSVQITVDQSSETLVIAFLRESDDGSDARSAHAITG